MGDVVVPPAGATPTIPLTSQTRQAYEDLYAKAELARQQKQAAQQLKALRAALVKLELTHHALAAELQGNNPESIKQKLSDLGAAGGNLGKFYSSLASPAGM